MKFATPAERKAFLASESRGDLVIRKDAQARRIVGRLAARFGAPLLAKTYTDELQGIKKSKLNTDAMIHYYKRVERVYIMHAHLWDEIRLHAGREPIYDMSPNKFLFDVVGENFQNRGVSKSRLQGMAAQARLYANRLIPKFVAAVEAAGAKIDFEAMENATDDAYRLNPKNKCDLQFVPIAVSSVSVPKSGIDAKALDEANAKLMAENFAIGAVFGAIRAVARKNGIEDIERLRLHAIAEFAYEITKKIEAALEAVVKFVSNIWRKVCSGVRQKAPELAIAH